MRLMVAAWHNDAYKSERLELGERLRLICSNRELYTVRQLVGFCIPADFASLIHVCRNDAQSSGKYLCLEDCVVAHVVAYEPVSTGKFPANREINREF